MQDYNYNYKPPEVDKKLIVTTLAGLLGVFIYSLGPNIISVAIFAGIALACLLPLVGLSFVVAEMTQPMKLAAEKK